VATNGLIVHLPGDILCMSMENHGGVILEDKAKSVPLHAMEALEGVEV
jgi:hypothetical protein